MLETQKLIKSYNQNKVVDKVEEVFHLKDEDNKKLQ